MSGLLELPPGTMHELGDKLRLEVINNTVNLDKRLSKLYELIENELLGSLTFTPASIASYKVGRWPDQGHGGTMCVTSFAAQGEIPTNANG